MLSFCANQELVTSARYRLSLFCQASGVLISDHKTNHWLIVLEEAPNWIHTTWTFIHLFIIVRYLRIPFGVGLSSLAM